MAEATLSKNAYMAEIIKTMVRLGIEDAEHFIEYTTMILPQMNTLELRYELENLLDNEIGLME